MAKSHRTHSTPCTTSKRSLGFIMERIVLVSFLPDGNGRSCVLHPFDHGNILVLNWEDVGVGLHLHLPSFVCHELSYYTMNDNRSDGCHVCYFIAREYSVGDNDHQLEGAVVKLTDVFMAEHENRSMCHLLHCNWGYAYDVVLSYAT
jgi:hypothetical protein